MNGLTFSILKCVPNFDGGSNHLVLYFSYFLSLKGLGGPKSIFDELKAEIMGKEKWQGQAFSANVCTPSFLLSFAWATLEKEGNVFCNG